MPFTPTSSCPFAEQCYFVLSAASSDLHHSSALPVPQHEEERASDHHRNIFYAHRKVSRFASLFSAITAEEAERSASAVVTPRSGPWNEPGLSRPQIERIPPERPQLLPAIGSEWKQKKLEQERLQRSENPSPGRTNGEGNALVLLPSSNRASDVIVAPPPPSGFNPPVASNAPLPLPSAPIPPPLTHPLTPLQRRQLAFLAHAHDDAAQPPEYWDAMPTAQLKDAASFWAREKFRGAGAAAAGIGGGYGGESGGGGGGGSMEPAEAKTAMDMAVKLQALVEMRLERGRELLGRGRRGWGRGGRGGRGGGRI